MIVEECGRFRSYRTPTSEANLLAEEFARLSTEEQAAVLEAISDPLVAASLMDDQYATTPVEPSAWLYHPEHGKELCRDMYPKLRDDFVDFQTGAYFEMFLTGSTGYGKCIDPDTEIYDVSSGRRVRAGDADSLSVPSLRSDGKMVTMPATAFPAGVKQCVKLVLCGGQSVVLSLDHPVLTGRGWIKAGDVRLSDLVATPRSLPEPSKGPEISDSLVKLVAYLLADGGCTSKTPVFTGMGPRLVEFSEAVDELSDPSRNLTSSWKVRGVSPRPNSNSGKATSLGARGIRWVVRKYGLEQLSKNKRLPAEFYGLPRKQVALFLNRFLSCDGSVRPNNPACVECTLASEGMIDDIRFLLLRVGVISRKYYKRAKLNGKEFDAWSLMVYGSSNLARLLTELGPILGKEDRCGALLSACKASMASTNRGGSDVIPVGTSEMRRAIWETKSGQKWLTDYGTFYGRERFQRFCAATGYSGKLAWLADSDVYWERVRLVDDAGRRELVDLSVPGTHNFVGNGVFLHNTFLTSICIAYDLYRLLCMRSPQRSYGMADGSQLVLFAYSTTISQAGSGFGTEFLATLDKIPFFSRMKRPKGSGFQSKFPKNILFVTATEAANKALGQNAIGGAVDESDFQGKSAKTSADGQAMDRAESVYLTASRRVKNRFMRKGWTPAHLYVLSSKTTRRSFMVRQIRAKAKNDRVKVIDYPAYDVRPATDYLPTRFPVLIGTDALPPRVLKPEEVEALPDEYQKLVTWVPDDFRDDFDQDVTGALQEIAGIAINPSGKFFRTPQKVMDIEDQTLHHPFTVYSWICGGQGDFRWDLLAHKKVKRVTRAYHEEVWEPLVNPETERYAHIDASSTDCPTGVAMGHISRWVTIHRRNLDTLERVAEIVPVITIDFMLQVLVPPDGEIDMALIRALLIDFKRHGFNLTRVTTDSYQAAENHLRLRDAGFEVDLVSTDKSRKVYDTAKVVINEGRLVTYPYPVLQRELLDLEVDPKTEKVVKPSRSVDGSRPTKDVADAVVCVVHELETRRPSQAYASVPRRGKVPGEEDAWVTGGLIPMDRFFGREDEGYF